MAGNSVKHIEMRQYGLVGVGCRGGSAKLEKEGVLRRENVIRDYQRSVLCSTMSMSSGAQS